MVAGADQPAKLASDAEQPERSEGKGCLQPAVNRTADTRIFSPLLAFESLQ